MVDQSEPAPIYCSVIQTDFDSKQTYYFDSNNTTRVGHLPLNDLFEIVLTAKPGIADQMLSFSFSAKGKTWTRPIRG